MIALIAGSYEIKPVSESVRESQLDLFGFDGDASSGQLRPRRGKRRTRVSLVSLGYQTFSWTTGVLVVCGIRARGRSDTPQGPQRATGDRHVGETQFRLMEADRRPRLGGPEEYKRSTRFPRGGAGRRSAGMRPDSLSTPEDGLGKRLRPCFLKGFYDDHVKRYKKRPIYWLITSPKGTLQALIYLHRYNRDTVNRFLNDYLRPYQQKLEAKRVSAEHVLTGGGSSQSEKTKAQKKGVGRALDVGAGCGAAVGGEAD